MKMKKEQKGVTLIALIITIIVLLILAGIGITMVTGQNGIMNRAKDAKEATAYKSAEEKVNLAVSGAIAKSNYGELTVENLRAEIANYQGEITEDTNGDFPVIVTVDGRSFNIDSTGNISGEKNATDIFDATGQVEEKLHIGDFINYEVGIWTDEDIKKIENSGAKLECDEDYPKNAFQFGGFKKNANKNDNATPYASYCYLKDASGKAATGWRLFDVDDKTITLISAGCPEDYNHKGGSDDSYSAYIDEYILTGKINDNAKELDLGLGQQYLKRDWSMYENSNYRASGATVFTKKRMEEWYAKYIIKDTTEEINVSDRNIFRKVYETQYENVIDNESYYWTVGSIGKIGMYALNPTLMNITGGGSNMYGIRILVSLPRDTKLLANGTKTVIGKEEAYEEKEYTYNVWNLAK